LPKYTIQSTPHGSRILAEGWHSRHHLDSQISPTDLHTLILAAFRSPEDAPRAELAGVVADRTQAGVRVRVVTNQSWIDIPWDAIARDFLTL
jgi:hypothetical protein